jgi:hypothetical protein
MFLFFFNNLVMCILVAETKSCLYLVEETRCTCYYLDINILLFKKNY